MRLYQSLNYLYSSYLLYIVNRNSLILRPPTQLAFILQAGQIPGDEGMRLAWNAVWSIPGQYFNVMTQLAM